MDVKEIEWVSQLEGKEIGVVKDNSRFQIACVFQWRLVSLR